MRVHVLEPVHGELAGEPRVPGPAVVAAGFSGACLERSAGAVGAVDLRPGELER